MEVKVPTQGAEGLRQLSGVMCHTIADATRECMRLLQQCLKIHRLMDEEWAENKLADLTLWASGIGALASTKMSLDSRLSEETTLRSIFMQLLQMLITFIGECQSKSAPVAPTDSPLALELESSTNVDSSTASRKGRTVNRDSSDRRRSSRSLSPWSDQSSFDSDRGRGSVLYTQPLARAMKGVESTINQLHNLSTAIRRTGSHLRLQKADSRFDRTEHHSLEKFLQGCMLARTSSTGPARVEDQSHLTSIQRRLIDANLRRRNRFLYAQRHSRILARGSKNIPHFPSTTTMEEAFPEPILSPHELSDPETRLKKCSDNSTATMLGKDAKFITAPASGQDTQVTSIASKVQYPHPPKIEAGAAAFKCPCCCQTLPRMMSQGQRWRKHLTEDIRPYTCIYDNCPSPEATFITRQAWVDHMTGEQHSNVQTWKCMICDDETRCEDATALSIHVQENHSTSITEKQMPTFLQASLHIVPDLQLCCPLCKAGEEQLTTEAVSSLDHIAEHVHSFALLALPWAPDEFTVESSVLQDMYHTVSEWLELNTDHMTPMAEKEVCIDSTTDEASVYFVSEPYFGDQARSGESSSIASKDTDRDLEDFALIEPPTFRDDIQFDSQVGDRLDTREDDHGSERGAEANSEVSPSIPLENIGEATNSPGGAKSPYAEEDERQNKHRMQTGSRSPSGVTLEKTSGTSVGIRGVTKSRNEGQPDTQHGNISTATSPSERPRGARKLSIDDDPAAERNFEYNSGPASPSHQYEGTPPILPSVYNEHSDQLHYTSATGGSQQDTYTRNYAGGDHGSYPSTSLSSPLARLKLHPEVLQFIEIPINKFGEILRFFSERPTFLSSVSTTIFEGAAVEAMLAGNIVLVQQCIQRRIIVKQCKKPTGYDPKYLKLLVNRDPTIIKHFYDSATHHITNMNTKAAARQTENSKGSSETSSRVQANEAKVHSAGYAPSALYTLQSVLQRDGSSTGGVIPESRYPSTLGPYDSFGNYQQEISQSMGPVPGPLYHPPSGYDLPLPSHTYGQTASLVDKAPHYSRSSRIELYPDQVPAGTHVPNLSDLGDRREFLSTPNDTFQQDPGSKLASILQEDEDDEFRTGTTQHAISRSTHVTRNQFEDPEPVDRRFKVQNGKTFFIKGKVFMMMYPEPKGVNPLDTGPDNSRTKIQGSDKEEVITHVKRFVVIRNRRGFCLCVPINSYGAGGIAAGVMKQGEKAAHAIIYDSREKPTLAIIPGEEDIVKNSIAVDMIGDQSLTATSRIHFGKIYTIEWNVKVMAIGQIAEESEYLVEEYWQSELIHGQSK